MHRHLGKEEDALNSDSLVITPRSTKMVGRYKHQDGARYPLASTAGHEFELFIMMKLPCCTIVFRLPYEIICVRQILLRSRAATTAELYTRTHPRFPDIKVNKR